MNFDYEKAWVEIDSLERQGLPKSALEKTEELLANARQDGKADQLVKALIYRGKYQSQLEEYGLPNAIARFTEEVEKADFPAKPILQSMLAELYVKYLEQNQWSFQSRTNTGEYKPDDIKTWSLELLTAEASKLYRASLADPRLKATASEGFNLLLTAGRNDEGLRPTLYDLLAHRAIDHFMNERTYLTQPAYKFYIDDERAFAPVSDFATWKISTPDTVSDKYQTLVLMQDLLRFRQLEKIKHSPSLLDADLKRLQFVFDNSVLDTKKAAYLAALEALEKQYEGSEAAADAIFALASYYHSQGADYQSPPFGTTTVDEKKWYFKKANDYCKKALDSYPNSFGAKQCASLRAELYATSLNVVTEQVVLPGQPFLARVEYRNLPQAWVKLIQMNPERRDALARFQYDRDHLQLKLDYLRKLPAEKTWQVVLPDDGDFRSHSTEIKMDALPLGQYVVMVSDNKDFAAEALSHVHYLSLNVSNLGFWKRQGATDGSMDIFVFDRHSGAPLKGVRAEIGNLVGQQKLLRRIWTPKEVKTTDADGYFSIAANNRRENFQMLLCHGKDTLWLDESYYLYRQEPYNQGHQRTEFFLDRAIYRPGQTVFFKGIALNFDKNNLPTVLKNQAVTVSFRDANYQETSMLQLRTNEYGTFSGQFTAPSTGLTGQMQLVSSIGGNSHFFRVEDYKRPKFEVGFDPVKETYRLNDTVSVQGKAVAYAGSNVDGAKVAWRVVREARFPWLPWWYRRWWFPVQSETMEIANGTATTDAEGKFVVKFAALPDRSIAKDQKPEFSYTVYADVTDLTGETQSNQTAVSVGYVSMQASVAANNGPLNENGLDLDSLKLFKLTTNNLNGEAVAATGKLKVELLRSPNKIFLPRLWGPTDKRSMTEAEFKKAFPMMAWSNEDEPASWAAERTVLEESFDTGTSKDVVLGKVKLVPGWYLVTLTTQDRFGEKVELKQVFKGISLSGKTLPQPAVCVLAGQKLAQPFEPGQVVPLQFFTSEKTAHVLLEIEKDGVTLRRKWLNVKEMAVENFPVAEPHRGNLSYHYSIAMYNRSENSAGTISVPWSNKDLTIEYGTFRDKLLPGQQEEWVVKIKGPKGDKVAAEMVAGMYDASLDAFAPNAWGLNVWPTSWQRFSYQSGGFSVEQAQQLTYPSRPSSDPDYRQYRGLNWFNWYLYENYGIRIRGSRKDAMNYYIDGVAVEAAPAPMMKMKEEAMSADQIKQLPTRNVDALAATAAGMAAADSAQGGDGNPPTAQKPLTDLSQVKVRTNLNETVFFFPHLMTDAEGNVVVKFKMNEALTRWKFLGLASNADLQIGTTSREVVTQKDLMVVPNPPRFFREFDEIEFSAKVSNLTEKALTGEAKLELVNALTGEKLNWTALTTAPQQVGFTADGKQSARLAWRFRVPDIAEVPVIEHTVVASAGAFSDAERSAAPVLSNRMLVTETLPLPVRGKQTKEFVLNSLKNNSSGTLRHQGLTLEFTQNPAWYAVQALPYLMEYPYECTEQIFSRYYANSLATSVANSHPKIKTVFDRWRNYEPAALKSNLSKNQELKTALLEETPWVLAAQSEERQKQNIALLFDLNRMAYEQESALKKLQERQLPDGGWAWFPGGKENWYISQYIVEGLGHLQKLGVKDISQDPATRQMVESALRFCDAQMLKEYEDLEFEVKKGRAKWEDDHLSYMATHYLYTRSFFLKNQSAQASASNHPTEDLWLTLDGKMEQVHAYYLGQAEKYWLNKGMYSEGMLALALDRAGKSATAQKMVKSLKERSLNNAEMGMYWKYPTGWWWYQAPIETHALLIEVFDEVANDAQSVDDLKVWLLKNKQTTHWKTTKATASAVYALLRTGDNWLLDDQPLNISFPKGKNDQANQQVKAAQAGAEAGTGYFKLRFEGKDVSSDMAHITVSNPNNVVAWGGIYWQYFEHLDKIKTFEETPLTIKKQLFLVENSDRGEVLRPIADGQKLRVGDKVKVRIELRVDRDMEYVHMKDMRASSFEPINVLSTYKWQGGLGYYESTRDAATNFFFGWLPKGTHVFEYPLRVTYNGDFSNGITTIQSMYAPEFTSHSAGIRVRVGE